ncbi:MAG: uroporphyrinogen decarboxylase family protein [Planctomycetota bacterium]
MISRERVRKAIHCDGPDRIPHCLPDDGHDDLISVWKPGLPPREDWWNEGDRDYMRDTYGALRYRAADGELGFGEVMEPPITDITEQAEYEIPDFNDPDLYERHRNVVNENEASDDPKYCLGVMGHHRIFADAHHMVGLQNLMMEFYQHPDHVHALLDRLAEAQCESVRLLHEIGFDGVMGYDDWGVQDSLLIGPDLIEEFFLPRYEKVWGLAHDLGMDVWLHTCGYTIEILPKFAEVGLNVAQLDQQMNMGLENLAEQLGGKLAFWCPPDIQRIMVDTTPERVEAYVKRMIETLGGFNGGFVSKTYPTPDDVNHKPEIVAAACEAFRKYEECWKERN